MFQCIYFGKKLIFKLCTGKLRRQHKPRYSRNVFRACPEPEFLTAADYAEYMKSNAGESEGIGVMVSAANVTANGKKTGALQIVAVTENSPAEEADLRPGDYIVETLDETTGKWFSLPVTSSASFVSDYYTMLDMVKGAPDSQTHLHILRPSGGGFLDFPDVAVTRKAIDAKSVYWQISTTDPSVGIIRLTEFNLNTPLQFKDGMDVMISRGIEKFVIDLRGNPGGDLLSVKAVASFFLKNGDDIVTKVDRNGKVLTPYHAEVKSYTGAYTPCTMTKEDLGRYRGYDYVVLVDNNTASAAEILTSVFRDYELAPIVGTTTYGKGIVQTFYSLADYGYNGYVKLTSYAYLPPKGECYHGIGIDPSEGLEVELRQYNIFLRPEDADNQLQKGLEILNSIR